MLELVSNIMLFWAVVAITVLLVLYGTFQPWWRSLFGWMAITILFALWQYTVRAVLTLWLGEDYPGRDWILLLGRTEVALSVSVLCIGLGWQVSKSWRGPGRGSAPLGDLDRVSGDL